jgi:hypothetical protein
MMSRMLLCLFLISVSFAFFPFTGEDADTLGKGGLQLETQYARFKHYDETVHKDVVLQITGGVKDNMDIALIIPYSFYRYKDGTRNEGFSDVGVFIKHIPVEAGNFKAGYKLQLNFNTGKQGIGYGKITGNLFWLSQRFLKLVLRTIHECLSWALNSLSGRLSKFFFYCEKYHVYSFAC